MMVIVTIKTKMDLWTSASGFHSSWLTSSTDGRMLLVISRTLSVEIGNNRRDGLVEICRHDRPRCSSGVELKAVNRKVKSGGKLLSRFRRWSLRGPSYLRTTSSRSAGRHVSCPRVNVGDRTSSDKKDRKRA